MKEGDFAVAEEYCQGTLITTAGLRQHSRSTYQQLASGLHYMHCNKVVHGRIRPSCVFLKDDLASIGGIEIVTKEGTCNDHVSP